MLLTGYKIIFSDYCLARILLIKENESLRRKDFDHMMQDILSAQEERERRVREGLNKYLADILLKLYGGNYDKKNNDSYQ